MGTILVRFLAKHNSKIVHKINKTVVAVTIMEFYSEMKTIMDF
jgi:hypothetical protein